PASAYALVAGQKGQDEHERREQGGPRDPERIVATLHGSEGASHDRRASGDRGPSNNPVKSFIHLWPALLNIVTVVTRIFSSGEHGENKRSVRACRTLGYPCRARDREPERSASERLRILSQRQSWRCRAPCPG